MVWFIQIDRRGNARIWSDNLQLPYRSKLEVIWEKTTSDFLIYNLKLPHTTSNFLLYNLQFPQGHSGHSGRGGHGQDRQDREIWHLSLIFEVTCDCQLSQLLRCLENYYKWKMSNPNRLYDMIHTYETELVLQNQSKIPASRVNPLLLKLILVHRTIGKTAPMVSFWSPQNRGE